MIAAADTRIPTRIRNRYGFAIDLTAEALDIILREHFDMPDGEIVRYNMDERLILSVFYRSDPPLKDCDTQSRIGEAGEYPRRGSPKNVS